MSSKTYVKLKKQYSQIKCFLKCVFVKCVLRLLMILHSVQTNTCVTAGVFILMDFCPCVVFTAL